MSHLPGIIAATFNVRVDRLENINFLICSVGQEVLSLARSGSLQIGLSFHPPGTSGVVEVVSFG